MMRRTPPWGSPGIWIWRISTSRPNWSRRPPSGARRKTSRGDTAEQRTRGHHLIRPCFEDLSLHRNLRTIPKPEEMLPPPFLFRKTIRSRQNPWEPSHSAAGSKPLGTGTLRGCCTSSANGIPLRISPTCNLRDAALKGIAACAVKNSKRSLSKPSICAIKNLRPS